MRELGLFAGAGGGLLASCLLGWRTVCAVEIEPYCQAILAQRQLDGHLDPFPIWDDIRSFDGRPWRGRVDVVSGGFPCQDISSAGKGAGLAGARSGLWFEMLRIIGEVEPAYVFAENSPNLRTRGLDVVLEGLAGLGYDVAWGVLGAWHVGAPHRRNRMWIVAAHPDRCRERARAVDAEVASTPRVEGDSSDADLVRLEGREQAAGAQRPAALLEACGRARLPADTAAFGRGQGGQRRPVTGGAGEQQPALQSSDGDPSNDWWSVHRFAGVDDGVASRVERVRATGNGQVPAVAALAWRTLAPLVDPQIVL